MTYGFHLTYISSGLFFQNQSDTSDFKVSEYAISYDLNLILTKKGLQIPVSSTVDSEL